MTFWYCGQLHTKGPEHGIRQDLGLKFGASVFTTLRVYGDSLDHPLTQWQAHCDRITHSLKAFHWSTPNWTAVRAGAQQLKSAYPVLRITIFPDGCEWITGRQLPAKRMETTPEGVACWVAPSTYSRSLPTHKTGNYLACWLARQDAQRLGAHEAILTSGQGTLLETSTGNLWGWKRNGSGKGCWHSPAGDRCLPGIMRRKLESILIESDEVVKGEDWMRSPCGEAQPICYKAAAIADISRFETVAYSNCAVGLLPIHTITDGTTTLEYDANHASLKALQHQLSLLAMPQV